MRVAYFRELRPYSEKELSEELEIDIDETRAIIQDLMNHGIVRYRLNNVIDDENPEDELETTDQRIYLFCYVGIAIVQQHTIICYPKYVRMFPSGVRPIKQVRQALSVILRLGKEDKLPDCRLDGREDNFLAVMLRLIMLYGEYGIYSNYEDTRVLNGNGAIDWSRTIDLQTPVISDGLPIYIDIWTHKSALAENNIITRLHRAILSECVEYFDETGLSAIFSISPVELAEERPSNLGDRELLDWYLEQERASQYVTWKQETIDLMRRYLSIRETGADAGSTISLGTSKYEYAWETACKTAFGDLLNVRLGDLHIELAGSYVSRTRETLQDIIPPPLWQRPTDDHIYKTCTLIPDAIAFDKRGNERMFCIIDAKYYIPSSHGKMTGQPGLESVAKQFLYQSAYLDFIKENQFNTVINVFLVPSEDNNPSLLGRASFPGVMDASVHALKQFSDHIDMWAIPADEVFDCYLENRKIRSDIMREIEIIHGKKIN